MKIKILLVLNMFLMLAMNAQNTYVFNGNGNWTDAMQWEGGVSPGVVIEADAIVNITGVVTIPIGTVIENSGTIDNNLSGTLINNGIINNNRTLNNNGVLNNNEGASITSLRVIRNEKKGNLTNDGVILITDEPSSYSNSGRTTNNGQITVDNNARLRYLAGGSFNNVGLITNEGDIINENSGTNNNGIIINNNNLINESEMTNTISGIIENNGNLLNDTGAVFFNIGLLKGENIVHSGDFFNEGGLSPGNENQIFGTYVLNGGNLNSYIHASSAILNIELGGVSAGIDYDQFLVENNVELGGTLSVELLNNFEPNIGDSFTVLLQEGNILSTFNTVNLPNLSEGKIWNTIEYDNTTGVVLSVISSSVLNVDDIKNSSNVSVFPNPTDGVIAFKGLNKSENISVFNMLGEEVLISSVSKELNRVDLTSLHSGVYFVVIEGKERLKIIKR